MPGEGLPETVRNAALRRVDWRFLVPGPVPRTAVSFARGRLAAALGLVVDDVVGPDSPAAAGRDLAVLEDPSPRDLRRASALLAPHGACYAEWSRAVPGGVRVVRRRMEAAGFTDVRCYWAWPSPRRGAPQFWVPLDAPRALRHFLRSRPPAESVARRLRSAAVRALWRAGRHAGVLAPLCVVARRPERPPGSWGVEPEPVSLVLLTGGGRAINKVVALAFAAGEERARLAVKLARVPEADAGLIREADALRAVAKTGARGVPRLLFLDRSAGRAALGETVVGGRPLTTALRPRTHHRLALAVADWLADLAGATTPVPRASWWDRLVAAPLATFERGFGAVAGRERLAATHAALECLGDLPLVCEQRDCSPWNLLVGPDGRLAVLDWESAEPRGLPALDLVYYLAHAAFFVDGAWASGRFRESYRALLDPATPTGAVAAECQARYAARTGLDPAVLAPLRLLTWIVHTRSDYAALLADRGGVPPGGDALRRSRFLALWDEELQRSGAIGVRLIEPKRAPA